MSSLCLVNLCDLCTFVNLVKFGEHEKMCTWWCLLFLAILVHLVILIDDVYFGENNEVWTICMWFDDIFGDNDFLAYTFEMMNFICLVD